MGQSHIMADDTQAKKAELNSQLKDYILQWRDERSKEEEELKRLKEKQAKRKEIRAEQEKKVAEQKRAEELALKREEEEKREVEAQEKKKAMEEAKRKRQEMLAAQKEKGGKKSQAPAMDARKEMSKSKEQVEEEMKISLSIRIKPLPLESMDSDELRAKANAIWNTILELETDKYDFEQRRVDQDYELKELNERRKLQLGTKPSRRGLDPEAFCGAHPPRIHMFSKYERRTDTRTYGDRKKLYEGGAEIVRAEWLESMWKDKLTEWNKRPKAKLPKWCGVRPGKKEGDPETPEGEEEEAEAEVEEEYEEEEEDYEEEEEE